MKCAGKWLLQHSGFCDRTMLMALPVTVLFFTFTYSLTAGVVGAPQMTSQPVSSNFLWSPLPYGTLRTPGLSIPWCFLPTTFFFLSAFSLLSLCLARWFWPDLMNGRHVRTLKFPSLYNGQKVLVWSSCLLDFGTTFLIGNVVFVAVVPDFCGLYSSLRLCCEGPWFTNIPEGLCNKGTHQWYLGTERKKCSCHSKLVSNLSVLLSSVLTWRVFQAWNPREITCSQVLEACDCFRLLSTLISLLMPLVLWVNLVFSPLISMP